MLSQSYTQGDRKNGLQKKLVFCYQNCYDLLWEKIVWEKLLTFEAEGREFAKFLRSLHQFIQTHSVLEQIWVKGSYLSQWLP